MKKKTDIRPNDLRDFDDISDTIDEVFFDGCNNHQTYFYLK